MCRTPVCSGSTTVNTLFLAPTANQARLLVYGQSPVTQGSRLLPACGCATAYGLVVACIQLIEGVRARRTSQRFLPPCPHSSRGHTSEQGRLGNVVQQCPRKGGMDFSRELVISPGLWVREYSLNRLTCQNLLGRNPVTKPGLCPTVPDNRVWDLTKLPARSEPPESHLDSSGLLAPSLPRCSLFSTLQTGSL